MYNIKDLSMISGMTDRTLITYLKMGVLAGEKREGYGISARNRSKLFLKMNM